MSTFEDSYLKTNGTAFDPTDQTNAWISEPSVKTAENSAWQSLNSNTQSWEQDYHTMSGALRETDQYQYNATGQLTEIDKSDGSGAKTEDDILTLGLVRSRFLRLWHQWPGGGGRRPRRPSRLDRDRERQLPGQDNRPDGVLPASAARGLMVAGVVASISRHGRASARPSTTSYDAVGKKGVDDRTDPRNRSKSGHDDDAWSLIGARS